MEPLTWDFMSKLGLNAEQFNDCGEPLSPQAAIVGRHRRPERPLAFQVCVWQQESAAGAAFTAGAGS